MNLATIEKWLRRAGAAGLAVAAFQIFQGLWRAGAKEKGPEGGTLIRLLHSRFYYIPISIPAFALLYYLWRPLPMRLPKPLRALAMGLGAALYFAGLGLFFWGRRTMGEMYDVSTSVDVQLYAHHKLVTWGPFAWVRHPLYVAGAMAEIGALLMYRTWTAALMVLNIFSLVGRARQEELTLAARFGDEWEAYKARVPGWLPRPPR